jgi:hypothetical protein
VTPKPAEFLLHLECCRLAEETPRAFTPFPNPSLGRCYQRLCIRLFCKLLKVEESQENMQVALNMTPSLARARGKKMRSARKVKGKARKGKQGSRGRPKRNGYFNWRKGQRDILYMSLIETDGVGLSIVLASEKPVHRASNEEGSEQRTAAEKRKYAQGMYAARVQHLGTLLEKGAICRGLDPGRVNLYTTAQRVKSDCGHDKYERQFYSRKRHLQKSGQDRMKAWREKRAQQPEISAALNALAVTGGVRTHLASRWYDYLSVRSEHRELLNEEFMYDDERYKKKMVALRLSQRALARAADRLVLEGNECQSDGQRRPVIIGYGNGRGNGGGHKGEQGVPVKAMYRAVMEAFKRHRIEGGVLDI